MRTATDTIENILKLLMSKPGSDAIYFRSVSPEAALIRAIKPGLTSLYPRIFHTLLVPRHLVTS